MIKALTYSSWSDFQTQLQHLGKKAKGDAFEQLVHHYFKLSNKFSMLYDEVWHQENKFMSSQEKYRTTKALKELCRPCDHYQVIEAHKEVDRLVREQVTGV